MSQRGKGEGVDSVRGELERLGVENQRLREELCGVKAEMTKLEGMSARPMTASEEIARLSEELAWHAKLHLYAEKERLRLLDLLEFAGREGKIVGSEFNGLREKISRISLRSDIAAAEFKCLV